MTSYMTGTGLEGVETLLGKLGMTMTLLETTAAQRLPNAA